MFELCPEVCTELWRLQRLDWRYDQYQTECCMVTTAFVTHLVATLFVKAALGYQLGEALHL